MTYEVGDLVRYIQDMGPDVETGDDGEIYPKFPIVGEVVAVRDEEELAEGEEVEYLVRFVDHLGGLDDVEEWYTDHELYMMAIHGSW